MASQIDGKEVANMAYHAGVQTVLTVGYSELMKKVFKKPVPKVDLNMNDVLMLTLDITLATITKEQLIKYKIIPADIMK